MIIIKSLRVFGLVQDLNANLKGEAYDLLHSLEGEGVCQGVQERSHAIPSKAWYSRSVFKR